MDNNVDRLKAKATIIVKYDIIPMEVDIEWLKEQERSRSMEDIISLLRLLDPASINFTVDFEEISDVPQ